MKRIHIQSNLLRRGFWRSVLPLLLILAGSLIAQAPQTSYTPDHQLDINNADYLEIARLPIPSEVAERIFYRIQYQGPLKSVYELRKIEGVDQALFLKIKPLVRIEPYQVKSEREERIEQLYYQLDRWAGREGTNQALIDSWIEQALEPIDINKVRYDQLLNLQGVSPVDAAAIIKYRKRVGAISSLRDLRSAPYLSYFGYRNTRTFVSFEPRSTEKAFHGNWLFRTSNTPFLTEEADVTSASISELTEASQNNYPDVYSRLIGTYGPNLKIGISHWHSLDEPYFSSDLGFVRIPKVKFYLGLENQHWGKLELRKLYLGNYSLAFGQGVVMENTDFFTPRKSGFGFRKRFIGLAGDNSRTREFKLSGAAAELAYGKAHLFLFGSFDKRDAILNRNPILYKGELIQPFNQLIVLDQRFQFAPNDQLRTSDQLPWRDTVKELLMGFHAAYDVAPATQIGMTYYESAYDRPLRPEIGEIVDPSNEGQITLTDNEIFNSYGGPVSDGENVFWNGAKSYRRVYGVDVQSVINNVAFQAEYAELDKQQSLGLFRSGRNPWAFVANIYIQFNSFNIFGLYRDYQLGFDNPYQRSFSNYRRFKGTIYEDYFYLQDDFYLQLYTNNPQPQNEKGFYLNTRYQINRKFVLSLEYDNWKRYTDDASQYRLRANLQYRPVFPISISLYQKFQGREALNNFSLRFFENKEFRGTLRLRLSRFDDLSLLYMNSEVMFHPRPRLTHPFDPTDPNQEFDNPNFAGTAALPGTALGASYTHNFNEWLKFRGFLGFYKGFFWNFEDTQFLAVDSERGSMRYWFSVYSRISNQVSMRFKYTRDRNYPITFYQARDSQNRVIEPQPGDPVTGGKLFESNLIQPIQEYFYMEFNYHF